MTRRLGTLGEIGVRRQGSAACYRWLVVAERISDRMGDCADLALWLVQTHLIKVAVEAVRNRRRVNGSEISRAEARNQVAFREEDLLRRAQFRLS